MFGWLKKLIGWGAGSPLPLPLPPNEPEPAAPVSGSTLAGVVDNFLVQNRTPTPWGVHAFIAAGGAGLRDADEVLAACEKIEQHGYQHPLNLSLRRELSDSELLDFLQWQAASQVAQEEYRNENTILSLIGRFRGPE